MIITTAILSFNFPDFTRTKLSTSKNIRLRAEKEILGNKWGLETRKPVKTEEKDVDTTCGNNRTFYPFIFVVIHT